MSNKARDYARSVDLRTASEGIVLRELAEYYNDEKGAAWPSIERLAAGCNGISEKTVRSALVSLEKIGHITRTECGSRTRPPRYIFNFELSNLGEVGGLNLEIYVPELGTFGEVDAPNLENHVVELGNLGSELGNLRPELGTLGNVIEEDPLDPLTLTVIKPVVVPVQPVKSGNEFFTRTVQAYESNIALITPMIADEIRAIAEGDSVRPDWGELAVREAASNNARRWSYVRSIINRYITQGSTEDKRNGTNGRAGISANGKPNAIRGHGSVDKYVAENEWLTAARNPGFQQ